MDIDPQTVKHAAPGLVGALGAIFFLKGHWLLRVGMVIPGGAMSYYGSEWIAKLTGMPVGLSGFVVGLLGMVFVAKLIDTLQTLDVGTIVSDWLRKILGLKDK